MVDDPASLPLSREPIEAALARNPSKDMYFPVLRECLLGFQEESCLEHKAGFMLLLSGICTIGFLFNLL